MAGKGVNLAGIAMLLFGIALLLYFTGVFGKAGLAVLPSFESTPRFEKVNYTYSLYLTQWGQTANLGETNVYLTWKIKSVKVDGVERSWAYPANVVTTNGVVPDGYVIVNNQPIVSFVGSNKWTGDIPMFNYDTSSYTGTHNISIVATTGFGSGGCFASSFAVCADRFASGYYQTTDYTFTDAFTNTGPTVVVCGNAQCESGETFQNCPADCPMPIVCNSNGACDSGETIANCPSDCKVSSICGDLSCNGNENCVTCATDCGACATTTPPNTPSPLGGDLVKYGGMIIALVIVGIGALMVQKGKK